MDLRQLEYFVAVAEEANFTRAAERVHISQSGVSAQIRQLERELGATLFDRAARGATLTDAGRAALDHARRALAAAAAVQQSVADVTGLLTGRVRVGMVTGCTVEPLFDALAAFHRAHPRVDVSVAEGTSDVLTDHVRSGAIDLALVGAAGTPPAELGSLTVVRERLVALAPPGHALAGRSRVGLAHLAGERLVCMPRGTGIRATLDAALDERGLRAEVVVEASAGQAVIDLSRRGLGVGVLSESMAHGVEGLTPVTVTDARVRAVLALVWRSEGSPAVRELARLASDAFDLDPA